MFNVLELDITNEAFRDIAVVCLRVDRRLALDGIEDLGGSCCCCTKRLDMRHDVPE
jgi:hypothetical protein